MTMQRVYSMSGYATSIRLEPGTKSNTMLKMELRSVNSRFFDLTLKVHEEYRTHEIKIREMLKEKITRGKVEFSLHLIEKLNFQNLVSKTQISALNQLQDFIRTCSPEILPLTVSEVISLARQTKEHSAHTETLPFTELAPMVDELIRSHNDSRAFEGDKLQKNLLGKLTELTQYALQAKNLIPEIRQQHELALATRLQTAQALPKELLQQALNQAITEYALKIDIDEELTRLNGHIEAATDALTKGGSIGKRLEFLIQELNREAHTLSSKSISLSTSRLAIEMKVLIEQMREQVQNIE